MDLLILSPWFPYPPDNGARQRAYHLIHELARTHRIRLVTGVQEDREGGDVPAPLRDLCTVVEAVPWRWTQATDSPLAHWRTAFSSVPRAVQETKNPPLSAAIESQLRLPTDALLAMELASAPFIPEGVGSLPVVLDQVEMTGAWHALQSAGGMRRVRQRLTLAKSDRYWRHALRSFDLLTVVSQEEEAAVRRLMGAGSRIALVPNGVDTSAYDPRRRCPVPGRLLYAGSPGYGPNREAVRWFTHKALPRVVRRVPEAHLVVTGHCPREAVQEFASTERLTLLGSLPEMGATMAQAAVSIVPLVSGGGGTRLKILEAWAAGVPVVSTTLGAAGLQGAEPGQHLLLADTPETFADAVVSLLNCPESGAALAAEARRLAEAHYDWKTIGSHLSDLLNEVVRRKQSP